MESTQHTTIRLDDFLAAFFPDENEQIHFRAFKPRDTPATSKNGAKLLDGSRAVLATDKSFQDRLRSWNADCGIYFTPNSGGSDDASITRFNAFFCEGDEISIEEQHTKLDAAPLQPSVRVETRKSVHAYWLVSDDVSEADWRDIQQRLIRHFDADEKIKNPSRVMRVPYFNHLAAGPDGILQRQRVTIAHFDPAVRYTAEQMMAAFEPTEYWEKNEPVQDVNARMLAESRKAAAGGYETWDALNAEAKLRIMSLPSFRASKGWGHAKGVCHNGSGDTGLALNLTTGAYSCQKPVEARCSTATILQALGLPESPAKLDVAGGAAPAAGGKPVADPQAGVFNVLDFSAEIDKLWDEGMTAGASTGWAGFDSIYTVKPGQFTVVTGIPSHGKSAVLDAMFVNLARSEGWHFLICSPENQPLARHAAGLMSIYVGAPFRKDSSGRMTRAQMEDAKQWLHRHFTFLSPDEHNVTVDGILNAAKAVHKRKPINLLLLDPWNELEHRRPAAYTETEYVSQALSRLRRFGRSHNAHVMVVAHPTKIRKDEDGNYPVPTPYDIAGSANWNNKADCVVSIWRNLAIPGSATDFHVQKMRFRECGSVGNAQLYFDFASGRFSEDRGTFRLPREKAMEFIDESAARTEAERKARAAVDAIDTAPVAKPKAVKVIEEPLEDDNPLADYFASEFTPPSDAAPVQYDVNNPPF